MVRVVTAEEDITLVLPPNGDQIEHGRRRAPLGHRPPAQTAKGAESVPAVARPRVLLCSQCSASRCLDPGTRVMCVFWQRRVQQVTARLSFWILVSFGVLLPL